MSYSAVVGGGGEAGRCASACGGCDARLGGALGGFGACGSGTACLLATCCSAGESVEEAALRLLGALGGGCGTGSGCSTGSSTARAAHEV
jgi:hypothetical protein